MSQVSVRLMRLEDLEQAREIDRLSFTLPWPENAFRFELMENQRSIVLIAEEQLADENPTLVGVIVVWLILDEAHVATLSVHPDYRGLGVSKKLLVVALKAAIRDGARLSTLEVRANNKIAQDLYRKFGFKVVGRRTRYYRDNDEDALLMTVIFDEYAEFGAGYQEWLERRASED